MSRRRGQGRGHRRERGERGQHAGQHTGQHAGQHSGQRTERHSKKARGGRDRDGGQRPSESENRSRRFRGRSSKNQRHHVLLPLLQGRVEKNPAGFAFLIPTDTGFDDVYVNRRDAAHLMTGDVVEFSVESVRDREQARIHRVLTRGQNRLVGRLQQRGKHWLLATPTGERMSVDHQSPSAPSNKQEGDWVVAHIDEYPTQRRSGLVQITRRLGQSLGPEHDLEIAKARYNLPERFSDSAIQQAEMERGAAEKESAQATPYDPDAKHRSTATRLDLRALPFVTIDGEDAKDFDDAILVTRHDKGFRLIVAIADVSFFVNKASPLDKEALTRGTSVYFPGTCLPMLPEILSNDLCSLRPNETKLSLAAEIEYDSSGKSLRSCFYPCVIRTAARLTYTQVQAFLDGKADAVSENVRGPLQEAQALYKKLDEQRRSRGVLDFELPECKIVLDETGFPVRVFAAERFAAHKLIEEFMIAANREVAKALREAGAPALYRVHEAPSPEAIEELNAMLHQLGVKQKLEALSPKAFAHILEATSELKIAGTLHHTILRLQKQAKYVPEPKGHFGLALADYTHFTSPIRRYPDLVVHRALKGILSGGRRNEGAGTPEEMVTTGDSNSKNERRAMEAERFVVKRKQCWHMERRLGDEFEAVISGVVRSGVFVLIPWMAVEGMIPLEWLTQHAELDDTHMEVRLRPGSTVLHLGDTIRVKVAKVSVDEGQITFAQVE